MPNENNLLPEHAQLAAVLDNPEAIKGSKNRQKNADCRRTEKAGTCPAVHNQRRKYSFPP